MRVELAAVWSDFEQTNDELRRLAELRLIASMRDDEVLRLNAHLRMLTAKRRREALLRQIIGELPSAALR